MRVAMRVDASAVMGTGHLRRCLSLARVLLELGVGVDLVIRRLDGVATQLLSSPTKLGGLKVCWLPPPSAPLVLDSNGPPHQAWAGVPWAEDADATVAALGGISPDWLVVDHYAFDERWHELVRYKLGCRLLVIDDVADRGLCADVLLDQNWCDDWRSKYENRLRCEPIWLTGPSFALLDSSYRDSRRYRFRGDVQSVGIFTGGADPGGASERILKVCRKTGFSGVIEVASTSENPCIDRLRKACEAWGNTILTLDEPSLSGFFARHDLQIGAGGSATWERFCMAAPSIALILAENQRAVLEPLRKLGVVRVVEREEELMQELRALSVDCETRRWMGQQGRLLVDGRGTLRVAEFLIEP